MSEVTTAPPNTKRAIALTGLSTTIKPQTQADLWIVYLPKGDRAVDQKRAAGRLLKIGDHAQNRGLATAGWSDERNELTLGDLQADVGERVHLSVRGLESQGNILRIDDQPSWRRLGRDLERGINRSRR